MAHRYNQKYGKSSPKPTAKERTWYRWRVRNNLENTQDIKRLERHLGVLESIRQKLAEKMGLAK